LAAARRNPLFRTDEAVEPWCPPELEYIWTWFCRLSQKRQNGMAINPLTSDEILKWQRRRGIRFAPFEEEVIDQLDALQVTTYNKKATT
jgi:hypothetical protein